MQYQAWILMAWVSLSFLKVDVPWYGRGKILRTNMETQFGRPRTGSYFLIQYFGLSMTRTASTNIALWWRFQ